MRIKLDKIICATDFSVLSNHAIFYGATLAREYKAKLYLCHVIDLSSATMYGEATYAFESQLTHMEDYAHKRMNRIMEKYDVEWEPLVTIGSAADEITRLAEENEVDLEIYRMIRAEFLRLREQKLRQSESRKRPWRRR